MILARRTEELPLEGALAVSVGVFDGVHRGHQAVFAALRKEAEAAGAASVIVTLDPHPLEVLRPDQAPPRLSTVEELAHLLGQQDPDAVLVYPFDRPTAALSPPEFLERLVPARARLVSLVVGYDFRMGKDRSGGFEELLAEGEGRGFRVIRVEPTEVDGEPISSSRIRRLVAEGRVSEAAALLGHPYVIEGVVRPGRGIGRTLEFPTANVDVEDDRKLLPELGVYAVFVHILGEGGEPRPGVLNRGTRPTFGATDPVLEVHIPGFSGDLVGRRLQVQLMERIREERRFSGPEALAARIEEDVQEARRILSSGP